MTESKKLLIVDGNSILNRAFYGIRPLSTKEGIPTNAVYGFITILKKHIDSLSPDYLACAFDLKEPTFRHKMYDGYKANRHPMPDELAAQLPWAKRTAKAMGFTVIECPGWEADDVLGTVAGMADSEGGIKSYILTGDRDSLQLITDTTSVILVKTKEDIVFDREKFIAEYGVTPEGFIHVKALMGDSSDNIPGVKGIGEKTAFKLIAASQSLDGLYADEALGGAGKSAREKLLSGKEAAYMSYELSKISREAPIGLSLEDIENGGADKGDLLEIFTRLEFSALAKRFDFEDEKYSAQAEITAPEAVEASAEEILGETSPSALAVIDGCLYCATAKKIYKVTGDAAPVFAKGFICHDYKELYKYMMKNNYIGECLFDTMSASYLLSPGESAYPIEKSVVRYLGEQAIQSEGGAAWYCARLYPHLSEALEEQGMTSVLERIEIPLSPVLAKMENVGFRLDKEGLRSYIGQLVSLQEQLCERIYVQAGREFNINSPKQLGEVLFEDLGLPVKKKTKTGYATDAETLSSLRAYHGIIDDILDFRQVAKLVGTYGENIIALCDEESRIHTRFNQTGTATGRLSSLDPNLQNIPVRGQLGRELRRYFTATDSDHILVDADYSQIELRLLAEMSGDDVMQNIYLEGGDIHASTAAKVFGVAPELVTKELRSKAKAVNFGIVYGIGDFSLSQDLHVSRKAAREYIDSYLATFPGVDKYLKDTVEKAKEDGYTTTLLGRRRPIPELAAQNKNLRAFGERVAMNSPIQGTAADIIKIAMINVDKALADSGIDARLILQVHDELIVEASLDSADEAAEILVREMKNAYKTVVPLDVEANKGRTWYDAK
ncbi:MAG: DNA polymerase I [Ruminococcaceae bacterium]|nr:DNA polymerase I [Oscillospiraceae bacterium]